VVIEKSLFCLTSSQKRLVFFFDFSFPDLGFSLFHLCFVSHGDFLDFWDACALQGPDGKPMLVMPRSIFGKRVFYQIHEYPKLLDSCNMHMTDWARIAEDIAKHYSTYDAFIVIHGTGQNPPSFSQQNHTNSPPNTHYPLPDTMAYTASALSFMLENLGKTVILTGSQVPLAEARNDAVDNLLGALTIAGHFIIPEVSLYFHNTVRCSDWPILFLSFALFSQSPKFLLK